MGIEPWTHKKIMLQGQGIKPWTNKKIMCKARGSNPGPTKKIVRTIMHAIAKYDRAYDHKN